MRLTWRRQRLAIRHRFATSQYAIDEKETLLVSLRDDAVTGVGEATPSPIYGQSLERSEGVLAEIAERLPSDPFASEPWLTGLRREYTGALDAVAAVDAAAHDWVGRKLGTPVWRLLGRARPRVVTSFTIGLADADAVREKVREALAAGFRVLKVKIGGGDDAALLAAVRQEFDGPLLVDANQAWEAGAEAERAVRALARFSPAMIEQPARKEAWESLGALRGLGVAPVVADESCETVADVVRLAGLVDGVNIKLSKCGGLLAAREMVAVARALGLRVMLGCFVSSSVAIAPALALGADAEWADLDGHLLLAEDPWRGLEYAAGEVRAAVGAGWGLE